VETLDSQVAALDMIGVQQVTVGAVRAGNTAMKQAAREANAEGVEALMEDVQEQMELAQEVQDALSVPGGLGQQFDEVRLRSWFRLWFLSRHPLLSGTPFVSPPLPFPCPMLLPLPCLCS